MLTFEKVLKVFQAYLEDDPLYEVVQTSHGYTLMAWEPHRNDWYSAEIQKTPEDLRNALLGMKTIFPYRTTTICACTTLICLWVKL